MRILLILLLLIPVNAFALDINGGTVNSCIIEEAVTLTGTMQNCTVCCGATITVDGNSSLSNVIGRNIGGTDITIGDGITTTALNNCFEDAGAAGVGTYSDAGATTLWSTDPLFRNPTDYDYRLKKGSPCAFNGTEISGYDYCGRKMPQKYGQCIGAIQPRKPVVPIDDFFVKTFNSGCSRGLIHPAILDESGGKILNETGESIGTEELF